MEGNKTCTECLLRDKGKSSHSNKPHLSFCDVDVITSMLQIHCLNWVIELLLYANPQREDSEGKFVPSLIFYHERNRDSDEILRQSVIENRTTFGNWEGTAELSLSKELKKVKEF